MVGRVVCLALSRFCGLAVWSVGRSGGRLPWLGGGLRCGEDTAIGWTVDASAVLGNRISFYPLNWHPCKSLSIMGFNIVFHNVDR